MTEAVKQSRFITKAELKVIIFAMLMAIIAYMGTDIYLPSMPFIRVDMGVTRALMQQSVSVYYLGMAVSALVFGPLSDRYGRRLAVMMCLIGMIMGGVLAIASVHIHLFLFARLLQGIGAGGAISVARSMIIDVLAGPRISTVGSYFGMMASLSPTLAPMFGGYLQHWFDWQASFIAITLFVLVVLLLFIGLCPETNQHKNPDALKVRWMLSNYGQLLKCPVFLSFAAFSGLAIAINAAYAASSSFIIQVDYHLSPVMYGWLTLFVGGAAIVGKFINAQVTHHIGVRPTLRIGFILVLLGGVVMLGAFWLHLLPAWLLIAMVMLAILGQTFIGANATSAGLSPFKHIAGSAGALYGGLQMLLSFILTSIVASLADYGVITLSGAYIAIGLFGTVIFIAFVHRR